jgi:hypothetical protein
MPGNEFLYKIIQEIFPSVRPVCRYAGVGNAINLRILIGPLRRE